MSKKIDVSKYVYNGLDWILKGQQKDSIQNYIYDASEFYMIDHTLMEKDLGPGNIAVRTCSDRERLVSSNLEEFCAKEYIKGHQPTVQRRGAYLRKGRKELSFLLRRVCAYIQENASSA